LACDGPNHRELTGGAANFEFVPTLAAGVEQARNILAEDNAAGGMTVTDLR
jgi:hypothetical protein